MRKLRALWMRLRGMFAGAAAEDELSAELESHLQMHIEGNLRAGMTAEEARRQALIQLGGFEQSKQAYRERRGLPWLETLGQDLRFGMRVLRKSPGFTTIAVLTLALGIGANTTIFSIVNAVLLNPLPFPRAEQLVVLHERKPNFDHGSISYPNFLDWRQDNHTFSSMATSRGYYFSLTGAGPAEQLDGQFMTSDFFETLQVKPMLGRTFTRAEEQPGAAPVVLISQGLWQRKFGSSPDVLGKGISLEGRAYTIVGVIPASFHFSGGILPSRDVYMPMGQWANPSLTDRASGMGMRGIARLKPGVTIEQANADMERMTRDLELAYPAADKGIGAKLVPLKEQMVGDVRPFLLVLLVAVGLVLLIACVNVASLMLARSTGRMREFAVRTALGASRKRVIRQLLTESLLIAAAAGVLGLGLSVAGTHAGLKLLPEALPRGEEIGMDLHVLLFTMTVSLLAGVVFGWMPALKTSQADPQSALKEGGRGMSGIRHRAQSIFVAAEMALALVLLIGAGLMLRSLTRLWNVDPGFDPHQVLTFGYTLPPPLLHSSPDAVRAAYREFEERLTATPGVRAVSQSWGSLPMSDEDDEDMFWMAGQLKPADDSGMNWALTYVVGPNYLKLMKIPLRRGRFFNAHDDIRSPMVAVIDDAFAHKFFPNEDPIGKRIVLKSGAREVEIVGVVGHVKQWGLDTDDTYPLRAELYSPWMQAQDSFVQRAPSGISAVVQFNGSAANSSAAIRRAIGQMSNEQIIYDMQTMESLISDSLAQERFVMILLGTFAAVALLLASVGIYGVIAYVAGQRTQEIGVRMALGAQRTDVVRMVLLEGMRPALFGIVAGAVAAAGLTHFLMKMLYGVSPTDPLIFSGLALMLALVAVAACYLPARRAASVEPMQALRSE